ncbi:CRE-UNC-14 protein [Caenorhabditis remanei]|uniref:CRE-UNC-14 protein n=1 Tax=Caenorhabditis remanei TaxID=31234 RepID=E3NI34_CAERE|nr:CRE-UNC-14 protein [Caenorhabditis remanei]
MVELCELHMMPDDDQWPDDIDARIAALNFCGEDSMLFESVDPSVSTDSLDSTQFRERCQMKKEDFQLAFADSGHWQSGINENLTTWGRIRSSEPLDERTASAPDVWNNKKLESNPRPNSLIANFVSDTSRFVDVNDNEIREANEEIIRKDRWRRDSARRCSSGGQKRTFADILEKNAAESLPAELAEEKKGKPAPKLEFLAMHHEMPSLCESFTASFRDAIIKTQKGEPLPSITSTNDFPLFFQEDSPDSGLGCSGPSHIEDWQSLSVLLPKHVAEACSFFKSNTQLLTSSISKPHSQSSNVLSNCIDRRAPGISASANEACRTCYRVRRRIHPPIWAQTAQTKTVLCDCAANPTDTNFSFAPTTSTTRHQLRAKELSIVGLPIYAAKRTLVENVVEGVATISRGDGSDLLVIAMRCLIEDGLLGGVSAWTMIRTVTSKGPATKDVHSIVKQLEECSKTDNVKVEIFFEELIRENSLDCWLCYIVLKEKVLKTLYSDNSFLLSASAEYRTLLWRMVDSLSLLPGTLKILKLKNKMKNNVTVIEARSDSMTNTYTKSMQQWGGASRIASDSRVPKSSSVPARLATAPSRRSRIPLSTSRTSAISSTTSTPRTPSSSRIRVASVMGAYQLANFSLSDGEKVRVLSTRGGLARCVRMTSSTSKINNGVVPIEHLLLQ